MIAGITPLILTYNEAPNIGRTLDALAWAREVVVVDSFSDDDTEAIVRAHPNARMVKRRFDTHEQQWNFALAETGIATEWILALDADYVLSPELVAELHALQPSADVAGYFVRFTYCIQGRALHGTVYPPIVALYRRARARYVQDGHTQRVNVTGPTGELRNPILHDDRKSLQRWLNSQSGYMRLEAEKLQRTRFGDLTLPDKVRRAIVIAPALMFLYCLFVRGNILDGRAGLFYAMQRSVAEAILSLYLVQRLLTSEPA
jgi:glycosyltransferase involved in cell wall biosynthesis